MGLLISPLYKHEEAFVFGRDGTFCPSGRCGIGLKGRHHVPRVAPFYFKTSAAFLIVSIAIGLHMGITQDHSAFPASGT
jgi:hypothetical protein